MAGLVGTHSYQLDTKGRVSLPARFREAFADGAYLTLGHDGCVFAFPKKEWERTIEQVEAWPLQDAQSRAYARMFFGYAEPVALDGQGRLLIPQRIRSLAGIARDAVVLGVKDRMEIWDRRTWERYDEVHRGAYEAGTLDPGSPGRPGA